MKTVYHYHPFTHELLGASQLGASDMSPREPGVFIIPGCATDVEPPAPVAGKATVWDDQAWAQVDIPEPEVEPVYVPTLEEIKEQAKAMVRAARKPVFYTLAGMQSEALAMGDGATATAIVAIQQALRDLPDVDLSACTTAESVAAVFMQAWEDIAELAPANVASAFNEVLAP